MRSRRAPAVARRAGAVARCDVARLRDGQLVVHVSTECSRSPRVVVIGEVDTTVVPGVSIGVEAASGFNGDER